MDENQKPLQESKHSFDTTGVVSTLIFMAVAIGVMILLRNYLNY